MAESTAIIKCFIASPSDTKAERDECDRVVAAINKNLGQSLGFRIETKKWEVDVMPGVDTDPQAVINRQILDEYQILIGIMWNRFGSPTPRAESGSVEEFEHALAKAREDGKTEIFYYFNEKAARNTEIVPAQLSSVMEFRDSLSKLGILYFKFDGTIHFSELLRNHLEKYALERFASAKQETPDLFDRNRDAVTQILRNRLDESLGTYAGQPIFWVEPVLSETNELNLATTGNAGKEKTYAVNVLLERPEYTIIKAPPEFGLTCLARYLTLQAWEVYGSVWVFIDFKIASKEPIEKHVQRALRSLKLESSEIKCLVVDSWSADEHGAIKFLKGVCAAYKNIPVIVMETIQNSRFVEPKNSNESQEVVNISFKCLQLLAWTRGRVRQAVSIYNSENRIGDEDRVLAKIVKDMECLNIHRTPFNCITLLKVAEKHFEESPANRTKMIELILFSLFDLSSVPSYQTKPDVKDCEYFLGIFCETLIKESRNGFSREEFVYCLTLAMKEKKLKVDVSLVFEVLFSNHILIKNDAGFEFKAAYWIFYFGARRMYQNKSFYRYVIENRLYISYPELMEFYTGIDRSQDEPLEILAKEIRELRDTVNRKVGLPPDMNPLELADWSPAPESLAAMKHEVGEDVLISNLPDVVKDQYADSSYDQKKPYDQSINSILHEYSLLRLMNCIRSCARALRNSDYADATLKESLLDEILAAWRVVSNILFAMAPVLATEGQAQFDGQGFILTNMRPGTLEEKVFQIFGMTPYNIVDLFGNDIYSPKMTPLMLEYLDKEADILSRHCLHLILMNEMPDDWRPALERYIISLPKNSFYLYDLYRQMRNRYQYAFATEKQLREMTGLMRMMLAKHEIGENKPSVASMNRVKHSALPTRMVDGEGE